MQCKQQSMEKVLDELEVLAKKLRSNTQRISISDASLLLDVAAGTIRMYHKAGLLDYVKCGREHLISLQDFYFIKACTWLIREQHLNYAACKFIKAILLQNNVPADQYLTYVKSMRSSICC